MWFFVFNESRLNLVVIRKQLHVNDIYDDFLIKKTITLFVTKYFTAV